HLPVFPNWDVLEEAGVPDHEIRTPQKPFCEIAEFARRRQSKSRRVQIVDAGSSVFASSYTVRRAGENCPVSSEAGLRLIFSGKNRNGAARLGLKDSRQLPIAEHSAHQRVIALQRRKLPYIRDHKPMRMVEIRRPAIQQIRVFE